MMYIFDMVSVCVIYINGLQENYFWYSDYYLDSLRGCSVGTTIERKFLCTTLV
jgi:hypothetical protein